MFVSLVIDIGTYPECGTQPLSLYCMKQPPLPKLGYPQVVHPIHSSHRRRLTFKGQARQRCG